MSITQNPNGTFEFSRGGVLWQGFSTRQAAQEAAYDLTKGIVPQLPHHDPPADAARGKQQPGDLLLACLDWIDARDAELDIAAWIDARRVDPSTVDMSDTLPEIAERKRQNIAEAPAAAAIVLAHLDQIAKTPEERAFVLDRIAENMADGGTSTYDWAYILGSALDWSGIKTSPGANHGRASTEEFNHTPALRRSNDGALSLQRYDHDPDDNLEAIIEERIYNAPEHVYEVTRLPYHGLVALATRDELFIVSEAEYSSQVEAAPASYSVKPGNSDGSGAPWITIVQGSTELDVKAGGRVVGGAFGGMCFEEGQISIADADDLRALLMLDHAEIARTHGLA